MRLSLLAVAALFFASLSAHADTVFNLNAVVPNAQLTGTVTLNAASTAFTINLTFTTGATKDQFNSISQQMFESSHSDYQIVSLASQDELELYLATGSLTNYQGGLLCSGSFYCPGRSSLVILSVPAQNSVFYGFISGSLTPSPTVASTPEPSSFVLLGTGLLGAAGVIKRRITQL